MKSAVVVFPGSNRERDVMKALAAVSGEMPVAVWHADSELPAVDLVVLPGGFSYGDYLRSGAIAARAPIMAAIRAHAARGGLVIGICNGFQILTEAGLLPGALMRNAGLRFVCREVKLEVLATDTAFTNRYTRGQVIRCPVAHHDGNYFTDPETLKALEGEDRVAFRYAEGTNPNGSLNDIAGILSPNRRVLGMMPHPENLIEPLQGGTDGRPLFESLLAA
ncbi:phosphoribosylformylglycinamidine synthase subunit PurQ [Pseudoxanthobacter sp.]|uniref:phosphoribosylformylglycinamidine synthase subunit PurQ n=1 Tax=Pseudoxanthobacter sp. TaxID=1925742 RepID=UPI002FDFBC82